MKNVSNCSLENPFVCSFKIIQCSRSSMSVYWIVRIGCQGILPLTSTKAHPQSMTCPPPCLKYGVKHSSCNYSIVLCLTNVLLCDPNASNLDSSVHNTFQLTFCVLLPILSVSIYWPVADMPLSLKLCLDCQVMSE